MKHKKSELLLWEVIGIPFLIVVGLTLEFAYKTLNQNFIIGLFSVINNSIWENLKIGFFSIILFTLIENLSLKESADNFFTAKALEVIFMSILLSIYYLLFKYNFINNQIINHNIIFAVICTLSQMLSFRILTLNRNYPYLNLLSFLFLIIGTLIFFAFTINPPSNWLFEASKRLNNILKF
ncbi:DUF6512 family protein [Clostridium folliculivorans]|uniref:Uncharacterized protein n=1 Tax=Clostridium folliculivorans TaxID=2886038 RepID=A0A9W5Y7S8_9CLOT|nr:DUF6512 family protein [Clostridium folliculivorans]GKU27865.1 hypothetical protein CFOLD11_46920 [Clostridium folliculivorans]GKU32612.1 hypothetical protein CFB3_47200 [Clostridium folliculivorans]